MASPLPEILIYHDGENSYIPNTFKLNAELLYSEVIRTIVRCYAGDELANSINPFDSSVVSVRWLFYLSSRSNFTIFRPHNTVMENLIDFDIIPIECGERKDAVDDKMKRDLARLIASPVENSIVVIISGDRDFFPEIKSLRNLRYPVVCLHKEGSCRETILPYLESPDHWSSRWTEIIELVSKPKSPRGKESPLKSKPFDELRRFTLSPEAGLYFSNLKLNTLRSQLKSLNASLDVELNIEENKIEYNFFGQNPFSLNEVSLSLNWFRSAERPLSSEEKEEAILMVSSKINSVLVEGPYHLSRFPSDFDVKDDVELAMACKNANVYPIFSKTKSENLFKMSGKTKMMCRSLPLSWTSEMLSEYLLKKFGVETSSVKLFKSPKIKELQFAEVILEPKFLYKTQDIINSPWDSFEGVNVQFFPFLNRKEKQNFKEAPKLVDISVVFLRDKETTPQEILNLKKFLEDKCIVSLSISEFKHRHALKWIELARDKLVSEINKFSSATLEIKRDCNKIIISGLSKETEKVKEWIEDKLSHLSTKNLEFEGDKDLCENFDKEARLLREALTQNIKTEFPILFSVFLSNSRNPGNKFIAVNVVGLDVDFTLIDQSFNEFKQLSERIS